jgi:hypothetical protein
MGGYGGNDDAKLGLQRISCANQFTIPNTVGTSPDSACNHTDPRVSQPNQAGRSPDFSHPLVILHIVLIFIPHLSHSHPQLYYPHKTQSYGIPLYLSMP